MSECSLSYFTDSEFDEKEYWETVKAVKEGYADTLAGRVRPIEEIMAEAKRRYEVEGK